MKASQLVWTLLLAGVAAVRLTAQTITTQPTNQIAIIGRNATFSVAVSGSGPFTYQWQFNGTNLPNNIITTVVGNGSPSYSGDGSAATNASLNSPTGVALDAYGNLFIADNGNYRIRKVDTNGTITTVAGNGTQGYFGDGGAATNANLSFPTSLAVDAFGNLFLADGESNVRKVDTNGIITTVAGNDELLVDYPYSGSIATNVSVNPYGLTVDNENNLFFADSYYGLINKVTNGIITTVAGGGIYYPYPGGMAATNVDLPYASDVKIDTEGNLFIAGNFAYNRIFKVDTNNIITPVAGNGTQGYSGDGGAATNAELNTPFGLAVDTAGNLFIAERFNYCIRKVDTNDIISTAAGNGTVGFSGDGGAATNAELNDPRGAAVDGKGNLFIADTGNSRIRKVFAFGSLPTLTLNSVTTNNAGNYNVIITGAQGSVTSSVVTLTVNVSPSINSQPQSLSVTNGNAASFNVAATGSPSLTYQWFFNGTNLLASTNAMLTLQNAFPANAGAYTVVITNAYGSITSNPAMLTVLPLGITAPMMLASGQFQFSFDTATGVNYTVECSTNLTQWFPWVTLGGLGVTLTLTDPNTAGSQQRFYRIILSPQ